MAANAAVFTRVVGLLAPVDEVVLTKAALPAFRGDCAGINSTGGLNRGGAGASSRSPGSHSGRVGEKGGSITRGIPAGAVDRAGYAQIRGRSEEHTSELQSLTN